MFRTVLLLVLFVYGSVQGVASSEVESSPAIGDLPKIAYTAPGLQIQYLRRSMPCFPKKTFMWSSDDANWLRKTFNREQSSSALQASAVPAVTYIKDVFVDRISTSLLFVFHGGAEKIGMTIRFPSKKEKAQAKKKGCKAQVKITLYGQSTFAPAYLVEFFKTVATKRAKSSFLARCVKKLFLIAGVWLGAQKIKTYIKNTPLVTDLAQPPGGDVDKQPSEQRIEKADAGVQVEDGEIASDKKCPALRGRRVVFGGRDERDTMPEISASWLYFSIVEMCERHLQSRSWVIGLTTRAVFFDLVCAKKLRRSYADVESGFCFMRDHTYLLDDGSLLMASQNSDIHFIFCKDYEDLSLSRLSHKQLERGKRGCLEVIVHCVDSDTWKDKDISSLVSRGVSLPLRYEIDQYRLYGFIPCIIEKKLLRLEPSKEIQYTLWMFEDGDRRRCSSVYVGKPGHCGRVDYGNVMDFFLGDICESLAKIIRADVLPS